MPEHTPPALLTEPATAAVRALNADPAAATYLAIAISAVRARDEEVAAAIRHLVRCPALDVNAEDAAAVREGIRLAGRLLYPGETWE